MSEEEKKVEAVPEAATASEEEKKDVMQATVHSDTDPVVNPKTLLAAGCHFGHRVSRWNPKMRPYIYGKRNNLHIIDLNKSAEMMQTAYVALKEIVKKGGKVLFVGTKPYAKKAIQEEAVRSGSFYMAHRWLGGTLTNFRTILKRINLLKEIEAKEQNGDFEKLSKKEVAAQLKLKAKLSQNLEGIKEIRFLPNALVVVDPKTEHNAIKEAHALHIPVFALGDTNTDPDEIDYLVPANDDGEASIRIIVGLFADAVVEGKGGEPLYAYKDSSEATETMADMLKGVDPNEQLKTIRMKLRDDAIAIRKEKNGGRVRRPKKVFHRFGAPRPADGSHAAAPAQNAAAPASAPAEASAPAAAAPAQNAAAPVSEKKGE
jgi:small subunit ribosomal protein S2